MWSQLAAPCRPSALAAVALWRRAPWALALARSPCSSAVRCEVGSRAVGVAAMLRKHVSFASVGAGHKGIHACEQRTLGLLELLCRQRRLQLVHPLRAWADNGRGDPFLGIVRLDRAHRRLAGRQDAVRAHRHGRKRRGVGVVTMVSSQRRRQERIQSGAEARCRVSRRAHHRRHGEFLVVRGERDEHSKSLPAASCPRLPTDSREREAALLSLHGLEPTPKTDLVGPWLPLHEQMAGVVSRRGMRCGGDLATLRLSHQQHQPDEKKK